MERLTLKFETDAEMGPREYIVEVPYKDGIVITNEFCPVELLSGKVDLLAAFRGEPLDKFMNDCRKQIIAISKLKDSETLIDGHIGGLMAIVMDHLSRYKEIYLGDLLIYIDCFSLLLKGAGFEEKEIHKIYPRMVQSIQDLYPEQIKVNNFANESC